MPETDDDGIDGEPSIRTAVSSGPENGKGQDKGMSRQLARTLAWAWFGLFVLLLLFPDGYLASPRWRWFARAVGIGMALSFIGLLTGPTLEGFPKVDNPLAVPALQILAFGLVVIPLGIVGAAISLVQRYRRSSGAARLQLKWLAAAASIVAT